jgi:hypothetical protein
MEKVGRRYGRKCPTPGAPTHPPAVQQTLEGHTVLYPGPNSDLKADLDSLRKTHSIQVGSPPWLCRDNVDPIRRVQGTSSLRDQGAPQDVRCKAGRSVAGEFVPQYQRSCTTETDRSRRRSNPLATPFPHENVYSETESLLADQQARLHRTVNVRRSSS